MQSIPQINIDYQHSPGRVIYLEPQILEFNSLELVPQHPG